MGDWKMNMQFALQASETKFRYCCPYIYISLSLSISLSPPFRSSASSCECVYAASVPTQHPMESAKETIYSFEPYNILDSTIWSPSTRHRGLFSRFYSSRRNWQWYVLMRSVMCASASIVGGSRRFKPSLLAHNFRSKVRTTSK